jgi:thiamine biosynthesis lipoprotein
MGTVLEIWLYGLEDRPGRALLDRLFERSAALERLFSRHDPESELSRLNQAAGEQEVDPELVALLGESVRYARTTHGAFDVTVGPLVSLWWAAAERDRAPSAAELSSARARVGAGRLQLRTGPDGRGFAALEPGTSVDLGGIAKGYALDRLAALAREGGARAALLSFGQSSLVALGAPPGEDGFRVLVRDARGGFAGVATLRDQSLSISGSLGQGFSIEGIAYGHVIDPRSGQPLRRRAISAVVDPSGSRAEALSKALLVLDPDEGIALLENLPGAEGLWLDESGGARESSGWRAAVRFEPLAR